MREVKPFKESKYPGDWDNFKLSLVDYSFENVTIDSVPHSVLIDGIEANGILDSLGKFAGFPGNFVRKLPTTLQAEILFNRLSQDSVKNKEFSLITSGNSFTGIMPRSRGNNLLHDSDIANGMIDFLSSALNRDVTCEYKHFGGTSTFLFQNLGFKKKITSEEGDILDMRFEVVHRHGLDLIGRLDVLRLICLNGMKGQEEVFNWKQSKFSLEPEIQLTFLCSCAINSIENFLSMAKRAKKMAEISIESDKISEVLTSHSRAMGIPPRFDNVIESAFREEPEYTLWGVLNAHTRAATHGEIPTHNAESIKLSSGSWVENFDMVTARLPRAIATSLGSFDLVEV